MAEDRDAAAVERMARAIDPEAFELPRINLYRDRYERAWERARDAYAALCAGPLPRAVLRRAIEDLRAEDDKMVIAGCRALADLPAEEKMAAQLSGDKYAWPHLKMRVRWHAMLDAKRAELDAEEKSGG